MLGQNAISEVENYTHLGIILNKYLNIDTSLSEANTKLRGTFLSLINCGLHPKGVTPSTLLTIYKSIVLPKALFGCEFWNTMSISDIRKLEIAHRFCVKFIQNLPIYAKTDIALNALGITSIESQIDYRKLNFLLSYAGSHANTLQNIYL